MAGRPSSQPSFAAGQGGSTVGDWKSLVPGFVARVREEERKEEERRAGERRAIDQKTKQTSDRVSSFDFLGRREQIAQLDRQQNVGQNQPNVDKSHLSSRDDHMKSMEYPFLTQSSVFSDPLVRAPRPDKGSAVDRLLERSYEIHSKEKSKAPPDGSIGGIQERRQRLDQQTPKLSPTFTRNSYLENGDDRQLRTYPLKPDSRTVSQEGKSGTEGLGHQLRTLLNDNKQRAGRLSPLPQAVQGAQGQKRGPSTDPTIKNEFSRMFAGIGSGVGSAGLNSGASTPFPPSPKQNPEADRPTPFSSRHDLSEARARNGSRIGKRARKVKDDETKDIEVIEDRSMGGMNGTRQQKKSRLGQSHHHHTSDQ